MYVSHVGLSGNASADRAAEEAFDTCQICPNHTDVSDGDYEDFSSEIKNPNTNKLRRTNLDKRDAHDWVLCSPPHSMPSSQ